MSLELKRVEIPPGQTIRLKNVTWQEFEQIINEHYFISTLIN